MSPPKILHIDTEPGWRGGQGQVASILSYQDREATQNHGLKLGLFTLEGGALYQRLSKILSHTRFYLVASNKVFFQLFSLRNAVKEFNPDVIHVHSSRDHTLIYLMMLIHDFTNIKVIVHRRVDYKPSSNLFSQWKYKTSNIQSYFCVSEYVRGVLIAFGISESKCFTVHSSVDENKFSKLKHPSVYKQSIAEELKLDPTSLEFWICPAALTEQKGHEYLIRAFKIFVDQYSIRNIILLLCGEGELRSAIETQISQNNLGQKIFLLGYRNDIAEIMSACDLVVLSSVDEGLGTSLLDAGLLKKAVLATKVGGIPEIISDQKEGILVPPKDPEVMAEAMYTFCRNPELKLKYAEALHNKVREKFNAKVMNQKILRGYQNLL